METNNLFKELKTLLSEAGIQNYEPDVLIYLSDYVDRYIEEIMEKSKNYMKHANRSKLDVADVKLALKEKSREYIKCRPAWKELIKLSKEHNKTNLPAVKQKYGIPIPINALNSTNFRMKSLNTQPKISYQIPSYSATFNELLTNSSRNSAGVNAVIRKFTGNPSINFNHQHIIFKQQVPIKKGTENTTDDLIMKKRRTL